MANNQKIVNLLMKARESGIHLHVEDKKLLLRIDKGKTVDSGLVDLLKNNKEDIIFFLNSQKQEHRERMIESATISADETVGFPLSYEQERLWLIDNLNGSINYHIPIVFKVKGQPDREAMLLTFQELISRHEILRTNIVVNDGVPCPIVRNPDDWKLKVMTAEKENVFNLINEEVNRPFDLSTDFMMRCSLFELSKQEAFLSVVFHHIAFDGGSLPIFIHEVIMLYNGYTSRSQSTLSSLPIQYRHYAAWQRKYLDGEVLKKQLNYWQKKLHGLEQLDLPLDYPRPPVQSIKGSELIFEIEEDTVHSIEELSKRNQCTTFITLLASFHILLYKITNARDITVGIPFLKRSHAETVPLIGLFMNTLAIRHEISETVAFKQFLQQFKGTMLEAYENQDVPFEKVVDSVLTTRDLSRSPLFSAVFSYEERYQEQEFHLSGIQLEPFVLDKETSKFDISFTLQRTRKGISVSVEYCSDLFNKATILTIASCYKNLLHAIISNETYQIRELKMLTPADEEELIYGLNATSKPYDKKRTVLHLIEEQAKKHPDNICMQLPETQLTYGILKRDSDKLAIYLSKNYSLTSDNIIGVVAERGQWFLIAVLAIWKTGAAFLPIEPDTPENRIKGMVEDAQAKLIITESKWQAVVANLGVGTFVIDKQIDDLSQGNFINSAGVESSQLAYLVYTSGSTGKPKGVMVDHQNLLNYCLWYRDFNKLDQHSRSLLFCSLAFDGSIMEIFPALICGATIFPINDNNVRFDAEKISDFLRDHAITHAYMPAAITHEMIRLNTTNFSTHLLSGGEPLKIAEDTNLQLTHVYGPTETTVVVTYHRVSRQSNYSHLPIGKPINNTAIYIIDDSGALLPKGVYGQICVSGDGVARGYLGHPDDSKSPFVKNPFAPEQYPRMYLTGDIGRWNHQGELEYRNRRDGMVKIRGFRVELGEIQTVLKRSPFFEEVVVTTTDNKYGEKKLVCYYFASTAIDRRSIREYLNTNLPAYLHPECYVKVDRFHLSANGKIDMKKLPAAEEETENASTLSPEPVGEITRALLYIWQEILELKTIGIHDNFFELGGHSLLASRIMAAISREFSQKLPIAELFRYPTIALLSERLVLKSDEAYNVLVPIQTSGYMEPIFCGPPGGGNVLSYYNLAKVLGNEQPVFAFQAPGTDLRSDFVDTVEEMAGIFIKELLQLNYKPPFTFLGHSFGGTIIYEMAMQLVEMGYPIKQLFILDTIAPDKTLKDYEQMLPRAYSDWLVYFKDMYNLSVSNEEYSVKLSKEELVGKNEDAQFDFFLGRLNEKEKHITYTQLKAYTEIYRRNATVSYVPDHTCQKNIPIVLFRAVNKQTALSSDQMKVRSELLEGKEELHDLGWQDFTDVGVTVYDIPCSHIQMMDEPYMSLIADIIKKHL